MFQLIGEMMRPVSVAFMLTALVFGQEPEQLCKVTLRVVDAAGVEQPPYTVSSFRYREVDYSSKFQGLRGQVPCRVGSYVFEIRRTNASTPTISNFSRLDGTISAGRPENWLTISTDPFTIISADGTHAGSITGGFPDSLWKGHIAPMPADALWVKITSLANTVSVRGRVEAEVDPDGEFRVYVPFFNGPYVLSVVDSRGNILFVAPVVVEKVVPSEPLYIQLPSPPTPITLR